MNPKKAKGIIKEFEKLKVLVIGDVMLDRYIFGKVSRISPEAPVPVLEIAKEEIKGGGAANVFLNLKALGCDASLLSVIGEDAEGKILRETLGEKGVYLISDPSRPTTVKARIVAHQQQIVRMDRELTSKISEKITEKMINSVNFNNYDGIIVSDYNKGVVTGKLIKEIFKLKDKNTKIFVDPKVENISLYKNITLISPNHGEAERITGIKMRKDEDFVEGAKKIKKLLKCKFVVITRGEEGMTFLDEDNKAGHLPTRAREVYDVTGAGDTVISILALSILSNAGINEACELANYGASVAVSKLGTTAVSSSEIISAITITRNKIEEK